jgi:hypothetical protein
VGVAQKSIGMFFLGGYESFLYKKNQDQYLKDRVHWGVLDGQDHILLHNGILEK